MDNLKEFVLAAALTVGVAGCDGKGNECDTLQGTPFFDETEAPMHDIPLFDETEIAIQDFEEDIAVAPYKLTEDQCIRVLRALNWHQNGLNIHGEYPDHKLIIDYICNGQNRILGLMDIEASEGSAE